MKSIKLVIVFVLLPFFTLSQNLHFHWAKQITNASSTFLLKTEVDEEGNIYTIGEIPWTSSLPIDIDPSDNDLLLPRDSARAFYIQKLSQNGNFEWGRKIEGSNSFSLRDITITSNGIYLTGSFQDVVDFDLGPNQYLVSPNYKSIYLLKLDLNGNFSWVKSYVSNQLPSTIDTNIGFAVEHDSNNNIYLTGIFDSQMDFDPGIEENIIDNGPSDNTFLLKLNAEGEFQWVNLVTVKSYNMSLSIDNNNDILLSAFNLNGSRNKLYKYNNDGDLYWELELGSFVVNSTAIDSQNNLMLTGRFSGTSNFYTSNNEYLLSSNGDFDIFILKLDSNGNFLWAKSIGGEEDDIGWSIAVDSNDNIYSVGCFEGDVDFEPGPGGTYLLGEGDKDVFMQKLNPDGDILWLAKIAGTNEYTLDEEEARSIAIDNIDNVYVSGLFRNNADFDPSSNSFFLNAFGSRDTFILKLGQQQPVGIENTIVLNPIYVFPNPSDGNFALNFEKVYDNIEVNVYDIQGKLVNTSRFNNSSNILLNMDLPAGVYTAEVKTDEKMISTKIILE